MGIKGLILQINKMLIAPVLLLNKWSICIVRYPDSMNLIRRSSHFLFYITKRLLGSMATTLLLTETRPLSTVSPLKSLILRIRKVKISG
jgi:hypothetical protein